MAEVVPLSDAIERPAHDGERGAREGLAPLIPLAAADRGWP
ncbi:hypothetical protein [Sphaerisporangium krabiense]|uniref:Uncharacterized protein n=1 Tax=Sphaerisporangium krabiense TaxID=763782 RepID=A0A7W9DRB1_9ACTN|nr:hypothetical protein [Sphaerisporangium krabiense]MBB5627894.1 hypothetical protein [Sphaerisporangium krabiense]